MVHRGGADFLPGLGHVSPVAYGPNPWCVHRLMFNVIANNIFQARILLVPRGAAAAICVVTKNFPRNAASKSSALVGRLLLLMVVCAADNNGSRIADWILVPAYPGVELRRKN